MANAKYLQTTAPLFEDVVVHTASVITTASIHAVPQSELTNHMDQVLKSLLGAGGGSLLAQHLKLDDVAVALDQTFDILTIPVTHVMFKDRQRRRALEGFKNPKTGAWIDANPVVLLPVGHGKKKAGLADATKYPELARLWLKQNQRWANGHAKAFAEKLKALTEKGIDIPANELADMEQRQLTDAKASADSVRRLRDMHQKHLDAIQGQRPLLAGE